MIQTFCSPPERVISDLSPITPAHCRAARALLDWSLKRLALRSGLSAASLRDFERNRPCLSSGDLAALRATFEAEDVVIAYAEWPDDRAGIGVWLAPVRE